jgi:hypothetical protein
VPLIWLRALMRMMVSTLSGRARSAAGMTVF